MSLLWGCFTERQSEENNNEAPIVEPLSDKSVQVGEAVEFRVVPFDPEGVVPALLVDSLPAGASFYDNGDGTRQFRWQPNDQQLGDYSVSFTAYDENEPGLRSVESIVISVTATAPVEPVESINPVAPIEPIERVADGKPYFVDLQDQVITLGDTLFLRVIAKR